MYAYDERIMPGSGCSYRDEVTGVNAFDTMLNVVVRRLLASAVAFYYFFIQKF